MTVFAACRFRPVLPAFVVKNSRIRGSDWNCDTRSCRFFCGTDPSRRTNASFLFRRSGSMRSSIVVHSEKRTTFRSGSAAIPSKRSASRSSFVDQPGFCLSTRNVLSAAIRHMSSAMRRRSRSISVR